MKLYSYCKCFLFPTFYVLSEQKKIPKERESGKRKFGERRDCCARCLNGPFQSLSYVPLGMDLSRGFYPDLRFAPWL